MNMQEVGYDTNANMMDFTKTGFFNIQWMFIGYGNDDVFYGSPFSDTFMGIPGNEIIWVKGNKQLVLMKTGELEIKQNIAVLKQVHHFKRN